MLLFELFPAFMAALALAVGIWLFMLDRQAKGQSGPVTKQDEGGSDGNR